jgi:hypothetical protein
MKKIISLTIFSLLTLAIISELQAVVPKKMGAQNKRRFYQRQNLPGSLFLPTECSQLVQE